MDYRQKALCKDMSNSDERARPCDRARDEHHSSDTATKPGLITAKHFCAPRPHSHKRYRAHANPRGQRRRGLTPHPPPPALADSQQAMPNYDLKALFSSDTPEAREVAATAFAASVALQDLVSLAAHTFPPMAHAPSLSPHASSRPRSPVLHHPWLPICTPLSSIAARPQGHCHPPDEG